MNVYLTNNNNINYLENGIQNSVSKFSFNEVLENESKQYESKINDIELYSDSSLKMLTQRSDSKVIKDFELIIEKKDGRAYGEIVIGLTNGYFTDELMHKEGIKSNDIQLSLAFDFLKNEAKKIRDFVIEQHGSDSELGFNFNISYGFLESGIDMFNKALDNIKEMADNKDISIDENTGFPTIAQNIKNLFMYHYANFAIFFNYANEHIEGIDKEGITNALLKIKGFYEDNKQSPNNTNLSFADGTKISYTSFDDGSSELTINGELILKRSKESQELENTKFNTLFSIFNTREKEENLKERIKKERINLNLEEKFKNTSLNTQQSLLSELIQKKL